MRQLLLERSLVLTLFCYSLTLGDDEYFYQQDYPAPSYYQELLYRDENYQPYYQEEYYQEQDRGGGYNRQNQNWRRQGLEEEDEEAPIPVIIKGSL